MTERISTTPRAPRTMVYTVALDPKLTLPQLDQLQTGTHQLRALDITVAGLTIKIDRPVMVTIDKNRIALAASVADAP